MGCHKIKWTDSLIKSSIMQVVSAYELGRMPSKTEVESYYNDNKLSSAISRRKGGWYKLAEELGLSLKECDTNFGKKYERVVAEKLDSDGYEVTRMSQNYPYDLLVNGSIKIDVKASRIYHSEKGSFYSFNIDKPFATCDIYILLTVEENGDVKDYYIVPSKAVFNNTQISIGLKTSKYDAYKNNWDSLLRYDAFMNNDVV